MKVKGKTCIHLLDILTDIIVGEPDEHDLGNMTLPELLLLAESAGRIFKTDYDAFLMYKDKILLIIEEIDNLLYEIGDGFPKRRGRYAKREEAMIKKKAKN